MLRVPILTTASSSLAGVPGVGVDTVGIARLARPLPPIYKEALVKTLTTH